MSGIMNKLGLGHKDHSADHHDSTAHHSTHGATATTTTTTTSNNSGLTGLNNQTGINSGLNQSTTAPYGSSTATSTTRSGAAYSNSGIASSGVASTGVASTQYNQTGRISGDDAMTRSEEQLRIAKQTVETGKAELNKTVETVHVEQAVPVAKERVVIEREPITQSNLPVAMSGPEISEAHYETTLREDRVAATKETVPIERIRLAKQTETSVESVGADLRKEHVDLTMHSLDNAKTDIGRSNLHGEKIDTIGRSGLAHDNTSLHSSNIGTTTGSGLHGSSLHGNSGLNSGLNNSSLHSSSNTRNI